MDMNVAKAINFKDDLLRLMMKSAMLRTEFSDAQQQEISDLFNAARAEANGSGSIAICYLYLAPMRRKTS